MHDFNKDNIRKKLLSRRQGLDPHLKLLLDQAVQTRFNKFMEYFNEYSKIALYRAKCSEIETRLIYNHLTFFKKIILYPCLDSQNNQISFRIIQNENDFEIGSFGILEPKQTCQHDEANLYVVPLIGFNEKGYRIGYGQGCYDQYFNSIINQGKNFTTIGLAYSWQKIDYYFQQECDYPLDFVVTDDQIFTFKK